MMLGKTKYFCNCLLKNNKEHIVAVNDKERCMYCGHYALKRVVTEADVRLEEKYGDKLEALKREYLELIIKDRRHNEKVN